MSSYVVVITVPKVREIIKEAWEKPVKFFPAGWREAVRQPNGKELRARILHALEQYEKAATPP